MEGAAVGSSTSNSGLRPVRDREIGHSRDAAPAIRAAGLCKFYRSNWTFKVTRGLESLDLEVERGEVLGLLGPNGAGKTTTLKLLTGLLTPSAGQAWLLGVSIDETACRRSLGFLPEQPYFYDYLGGLEYLELAAGLSGVEPREIRARASHWLDRVGLGARPKLRLRKYSKGMLQRLGLAAALVHEPKLLILDEPMSGLDPLGRRDVRELILEQKARGTTVLFSSHILPDVEALCDRAAIILDGRLRRIAPVGELVDQGVRRVLVRCEPLGIVELPAEWGSRVKREDRGGETELHLGASDDVNRVLDWLIQRGKAVHAVTPERATLEALFLATAAGASDQTDRRSA